MLADYVTEGGKLLVAAGPVKDGSLENLYGLLSDYGVQAQEGIVVEADRMHYAFQRPYILLPDMSGHAITDSLIEENYYPIMPTSTGLVADSSSGSGTVTELLTTSYDSFSKTAGYDLSTYDWEEGDIEGPFAVAVSVENSQDRYDGNECLAVVDGEPVSFVQRSDVVDLIEAVHGIVLNE